MSFYKSIPLGLIASMGFTLFPSHWAPAQPTGFALRKGDAKVIETPNGLLIQSVKNTLIDWNSFSIAKEELVHFAQDGPKSFVLNRVRGDTPSEILGTLLSNGSVFLVNPNGILIGKDAYIDTGGFIASTLDFYEEDLALRFRGDSDKSVVNEGKIVSTAGDVFLIAAHVENSGEIEAKRQGLLAGKDIYIRAGAAPVVQIRARGEIDPDELVENPYALAIRHSGKAKGSEVYLSAEQGLTQVSGSIHSPNGTVHVLGDRVHLEEGTLIAVSSGTMLIGGDNQGLNPDIKNAKRTVVEPNVLLKANAGEIGDGGKVIVWSDEGTSFWGHIDIRGGNEGGDGGFAEVSGSYLDFQGTVDGAAPKGKYGTLLLDPTNITIAGTGAPSNGSFTAGVWTSTGSTATIPSTTNANSVQTLLGSVNVTINTSTQTGGPFASVGTITWPASNVITWSAATTLTLVADTSISLSSSITNTSATTGFTAMQFVAYGTNGNAGTVTHAISATNTITLQTNGGDMILFGINPRCASSGGPTGVLTFTGTTLTSGAGNITIGGIISDNGTNVAGRGISINGPISSTSGTIRISGSSSCTLNTANVSSGVDCAASVSTSGTTFFGPTITDPVGGTFTVTGCKNVVGNTNAGFKLRAPLTTTGSIVWSDVTGVTGLFIASTMDIAGQMVATNNIVSGNVTGGSDAGYRQDVAGSDVRVAGSIQITASSVGGGGGTGVNDGINVANSRLSSTNSFITLQGQSGPSTTSAHGIRLEGTTSVVAASGTLTLIGTGTAVNANSSGITLEGTSALSSSATLTMTGVGAASPLTSNGVFFNGGTAATTSTGTITISGIASGVGSNAGIAISTTNGVTASSGPIFLSGTSTASGTGSHGVSISATTEAFATTGTLLFQNCSGGAGSASHGINASGTTLSTGSNFIATNNIVSGSGTGSSGALILANTSAAGRIEITATTPSTVGALTGIAMTTAGRTISTTAGGTVTLIGTSLGTGASSIGISFAGGSVSGASTGTITLQGSTANTSSVNAHGVQISANYASTATQPTIFTTCTAGTGGYGVSVNASFTTAGPVTMTTISGSTVGAGAVNIAGTVSITGTLTATTAISGGSANNAIGWTNAANLTASNIAITASSSGTSGGCQGIMFTSGTMTSGTGITTLIGTGGVSDSPSSGINFTAGFLTSTTGSISLTGTGSGTGGSRGINLAATNSITSTSGTITLVGTTTASGTDPHGINISVPQSMLTTGPVTMSGASTNGFPIRVGSNVTTGGLLTFSSNVGVGISTATTVTITNSGTMTFNGTIDGYGVGINSLTLNAGAGTVVLNGNVGSTNRLAAFTIVNAGLQINASAITANSVDVQNSIPTILAFAGTTTISTATAGGNINFSGTINGNSAGANSLTLAAGTGNIFLSGNIGNTTRVGTLTLSTATTATFGSSVSTVNVAAFATVSPVAAVLSSALTTFNANGASGIVFGGSLNGLINDTSSATFLSTAGPVTFSGNVGDSIRLATFLVSSATVANFGANASTVTVDTFTINTAVPTVLQGTGSTAISTSSAGGNITFGGTINGDTLNAHSLSLASGAGNLILSGNIGASTPIGSFTLTGAAASFGSSVSTVAAASISVTPTASFAFVGTTTMNTSSFNGPITFNNISATTAQNLSFVAGTGTVNFNGNTTAGNVAVTSAGSAVFGSGTHSFTVTAFSVAAGIASTLVDSGALTITSSVGSISWGGTIDNTVTAGGHSLSLASATTAVFSGSIGSTLRIGAFAVTSGTAVQFQSGVSTVTANSVNIASAIPSTFAATTTTVDTSGVNGNIFFGGTVDGPASTTFIARNGTIHFARNIGTNTPINAFTTVTTSDLTFESNVSQLIAASVSVSALSPTTMLAPLLTIDTTGNISLGSAVSANSLTMDSSAGSITLGGANTLSGDMIIANAVNVTAVAITADNLTQVAGSGTSTFNGALVLAGDLSLTGNNFTTNSTVVAVGMTVSSAGLTTLNGTITLTADLLMSENQFTITQPINATNVTITNAGLLSISSTGDMFLSGFFLQNGVGSVETAGNIDATLALVNGGDIEFFSDVTLTGDVTFSADGNVTFGSTIDGPYAMTVVGTNVIYTGAVGSSSPLSSIDTTATGTISVGDSQTVFAGPMNYTGPVILTAASDFTDNGASGITFTAAGNAITSAFDCMIFANGSTVDVTGDIDLSDTTGNFLLISGQSGVTIDGNISTEGSAGSGGQVTITSSGGSVSVLDIVTTGTGGTGGDITLRPNGTYSGGYPVGIIVLGGDLVAGPVSNLGGIITLSANRASESTVATITSSQAGNDVAIMCKRIQFGKNEALTVLGNLSLQATYINEGDTVALENLSIDASAAPGILELDLHGDIEILSNLGILYISPSLHFLSGGSYAQSGSTFPSGPLHAGTLGLSAAEFDPLLHFSGHILNYDAPEVPVPPGPPGPFTPAVQTFEIYQLDIAGAELSDRLPLYWNDFPPDYSQRQKEKE